MIDVDEKKYSDNNFSDKIKIICPPSLENPFVVIYKPHGIPSAPLAKNKTFSENESVSALEQAISFFPEIKSVSSRLPHEYGLLHRLDTAAAGLMLIATTQSSYDSLFLCQQQGSFEKSYKAKSIFFQNNIEILGGFPPFVFDTPFEDIMSFFVTSAFRSYGLGNKSVRPVTNDSGKAAKKKSAFLLYTTNIEISKNSCEKIFDVTCTIKKGFRHQVRCHLAWSGFPILGDKLYNAHDTKNFSYLNFTAFKISFLHPILKTKITIEI